MEITIERKGQTMQLKDMLFPECTLIHVKADRKEDVIWKLYEKLLQNGKVTSAMVPEI